MSLQQLQKYTHAPTHTFTDVRGAEQCGVECREGAMEPGFSVPLLCSCQLGVRDLVFLGLSFLSCEMGLTIVQLRDLSAAGWS